MSQEGDTRRHQKYKKNGTKSGGYFDIWHSCINCGKGRWVRIEKRGSPRSIRCLSCALKERNRKGSESPKWKGGRIRSNGYILIWLQSDDFFYPMIKGKGYILEHRLTMAKHLGRNLQSWEIVHHKNHIRDDNRIENLQLVTDDRHKQITILETRIKHLERRVTLLEVENIRLLTQMGGAVGAMRGEAARSPRSP